MVVYTLCDVVDGTHSVYHRTVDVDVSIKAWWAACQISEYQSRLEYVSR